MQNLGSKNFDDSTYIRHICQTFPPSKFYAIRYCVDSQNEWHHDQQYLKAANFLQQHCFISFLLEFIKNDNSKASKSISISVETFLAKHDSLSLFVFSLLNVRHKCQVVHPRSYSSV